MEYRSAQIQLAGRIDKVLAQISDLSRTRVKKLLQSGCVWHGDDEITEPDYKVQAGDVLKWHLPEPEALDVTAEKIALDVLHEDSDLLVVNKPAFMCVHPAPGQWQGTLVNALLYHCGASLSGIGGVMRPGIVHRLDKDTSGILVVAKNDNAHHFLSAQFASHVIERKYMAFTKKTPREPQAKLHGYIGRHPTHRKKMHLFRDENKGKEAIMHYRLQQNYHNQTAKIECQLYTGRTHQIRVQMSAHGLPLIGDTVYGSGVNMHGGNVEFHRQALHAFHLSFKHPATEQWMSFTSDLPDDLQQLEQQLANIH